MDLSKNFVITVSREVGSGGHTIAKKLADKLGVRFLDKQVMQQMMKQFGLTVYEIERIKAKKKNWFVELFDSVAPVSRGEAYLESTPSAGARSFSADEIAATEKELLTSLASEEPCVVAGRAAFAILKDFPNTLNVFIRSSYESRVARVVRKQGVSEEQAKILIDSIDEGRENYVKRINGRSRYDVRNYDLILNMDQLPYEEAAVEVILKYLGTR